MTSPSDIVRLQRKAAELRCQIVTMMQPGKAHHYGGSLSAADLVTALYFHKMRYDPQHPGRPDRDRFIMSKGHSVPAQYAALALCGVLSPEELPSLKCMGSRLQGHPAMQHTPGLEGCTGALGEGLSYANGMALAGRILGLQYRVYCLIGDGEQQEGQIWEAAMTSSRHRLGSVVAIIDRNRLKGMDAADSSKPMEPMTERWASFGWAVRRIDGHDMAAICEALDWTDANREQPSAIIADTIKGKGISFMEGQPTFHNSPLNEEQYRQALAEATAAVTRMEAA